MKTILIDDNGRIISCTNSFYFKNGKDIELTKQERINLGYYIFSQAEIDNEGRIIFYTGIQEKEVK